MSSCENTSELTGEKKSDGRIPSDGVLNTSVSGLPDSVFGVKISKNAEGVEISWNSSENANDYGLYLAVNPTVRQSNASKYTFIHVYGGTEPKCRLAKKQLENALIEKSPRPAVVFRIVARNAKGFSNAIQVNWLQDDHSLFFITAGKCFFIVY